MKKIWSGAAALAAAVGVICAAIPGAGAEGLTVKYDLRSKSIAVSGYGANSGGRAVNLVLMKKGDEPGAAEPVSVVIAKTGADGNYSADIRLSPQLSPGEYMLYVSSAAVSDEAVAIVPDSDAGTEILAQANRAATAAAFSQVVKNGRVQLGAEGCKKYFSIFDKADYPDSLASNTDGTHLSYLGAREVCAMICDEICDNVTLSGLAALIK